MVLDVDKESQKNKIEETLKAKTGFRKNPQSDSQSFQDIMRNYYEYCRQH